jgi:hypothetical protein
MHLACSHVMIQNNHTNLTSKTIIQILLPKQSYKSYDPKQLHKSYSSPFTKYVVQFSFNSRDCFIPPTNPCTFILAIVSIHLRLLLYITPSYMTLHLGIYRVEIILIQSTSYPHTYDLKVIQIADLIIIIIIIIILSRKKMKTQP